jgi:flavin reductase (DIM6/NTAB) family NADH-FMN oxidoreductase RutF
MTTFRPEDLETVDAYKLMVGLVVPRPIGWIGTIAADGTRNLAPYSFFNAVSAAPPTVIFSTGRRGRRAAAPDHKDTLTNVLESGVFTVNVVTEDVAASMNLTSGDYRPEIDEFTLAGLTSRPGEVVIAPIVAEATAALECRMTQTVAIGDHANNTVVFGEVARIHVATEILDGTRVDPMALRAVGRMAGAGYARTVDGYFEMERPG